MFLFFPFLLFNVFFSRDFKKDTVLLTESRVGRKHLRLSINNLK